MARSEQRRRHEAIWATIITLIIVSAFPLAGYLVYRFNDVNASLLALPVCAFFAIVAYGIYDWTHPRYR